MLLFYFRLKQGPAFKQQVIFLAALSIKVVVIKKILFTNKKLNEKYKKPL